MTTPHGHQEPDNPHELEHVDNHDLDGDITVRGENRLDDEHDHTQHHHRPDNADHRVQDRTQIPDERICAARDSPQHVEHRHERRPHQLAHVEPAHAREHQQDHSQTRHRRRVKEEPHQPRTIRNIAGVIRQPLITVTKVVASIRDVIVRATLEHLDVLVVALRINNAAIVELLMNRRHERVHNDRRQLRILRVSRRGHVIRNLDLTSGRRRRINRTGNHMRQRHTELLGASQRSSQRRRITCKIRHRGRQETQRQRRSNRRTRTRSPRPCRTSPHHLDDHAHTGARRQQRQHRSTPAVRSQRGQNLVVDVVL